VGPADDLDRHRCQPRLLAQRHGPITDIGPDLAPRLQPDMAVYAASKHAPAALIAQMIGRPGHRRVDELSVHPPMQDGFSGSPVGAHHRRASGPSSICMSICEELLL
jgi:short-subunit dehydrogenase